MLIFTTTKELICLSLEVLRQFLKKFVFTREHSKILALQRKHQRVNRENTWRYGLWAIHCFLQEKLLWTRHFIGIRQSGAKPLSELMLVSCIHVLLVKWCQSVCTQNESYIWSLANLNRIKIRRGVLKSWFCHTFSESDSIVKWELATRQVHRKNLMHKVLLAFVNTATVFLKPTVAAITFAHVVSLIFPPLRDKSDAALERDSNTKYKNNTTKNRVIKSIRGTIVVDGSRSRWIKLFNSACANLSPAECFSEKSFFLGNIKSWSLLDMLIVNWNTRQSARSFCPFSTLSQEHWCW